MSSSSSFDVSNLFSAQGLVAVVTGGGTGIGLMIATALESSGATVYIVGRRKEVLEKAAKDNAKHGRIIPIQGDVTSRESLLSVVSTIESQTGYINLLVNNSGTNGPKTIAIPSPDVGSIKEVQKILWEPAPEAFQQAYEVNITAVYYTTVAFLELLDKGNKQGGIPGVTSQVVTVASIAGLRRDGKIAGLAYATSKAAAIHLGKILASLLKDWQIRSNVIAPGLFPSEMTTDIKVPDPMTSDFIPIKRAGMKDDMGGLILYLATRAGAYTNGEVIVIDGGRIGLFPSTF